MRHFTKVWVLFLVLVIALAGVGVGFAHWSQTLTIDSTTSTGTLTVGIRGIDTNDPSGAVSNDPACNSALPCPCFERIDKDVASIDSTPGTWKCNLDGTDYYHSINLVTVSAYPCYCPCVEIEIANCGTVPADLDALDIVPTYVSGTDLTSWLELTCCSIKINDVDVTATWDGQLDPGEKVVICSCLHFMQENATDEELPQGKTMWSKVTLEFTQWNAE